MKKIYSLIAAIALVFSANAQKNVAGHMPNAHERAGFTPRVITTPHTRAAGDTLFYFDGNSFMGMGIDQSTFGYGNEDIDAYTIHSTLQSVFGVTCAYRFFYDVNSVTADTNFFLGATSWFDPPNQSDDWFEMGPIAIPAAGATLSWKHHIQDGDYRDGYNVWASTTGLSNYTDFTDTLYTVADQDPSTAADTVGFPDQVYYSRSTDLSAYAGQSIYIAFQHYADDMFILYLDDILVTEGPAVTTGVTEFSNGAKLFQNMPNPFSNTSVINYQLERSAPVVLSVYDVTGKKVAEQNEGTQSEGSHIIHLSASDLSAGVYYYSLNVGGNTTATMKMVVLK